MKTTTTSTPPVVPEETIHVFHGNGPVLQVVSEKVIRPEDVTENQCIRDGCSNFSIVSLEWEDEYCSNECAIFHCKDVFKNFVAANKNGQAFSGTAA
jgi:hypothetical protein